MYSNGCHQLQYESMVVRPSGKGLRSIWCGHAVLFGVDMHLRARVRTRHFESHCFLVHVSAVRQSVSVDAHANGRCVKRASREISRAPVPRLLAGHYFKSRRLRTSSSVLLDRWRGVHARERPR